MLALITARGGSKGFPGKNITNLAGKPLIAWTIEAAQTSETVDRLILSTDAPKIASVAQSWGCEVPFYRPPDLATDTAPSLDVIHHAMSWLEEHDHAYDYLVLLQPTSPLRIAEDIDACVRLAHETQTPLVLSVTESGLHPYLLHWRAVDGTLAPLLERSLAADRRQDAPVAYAINGAVYVARWEPLKKINNFLNIEALSYVMPRERSIDIDDALDVAIAETLKTN